MERWNKLLDEWQETLVHIEDELRSCPVVKNIVSERIGPEQCAELDLDSGAVTIVDESFGVELSANSVLLLAQFLSDHAVIIGEYIQKVSE